MEGFYIFYWDLLGSETDGLVFYSRIACLTHVTVTIYIIIDEGDDDDANNINNNIFSDTSSSKHRHNCIPWYKSLLKFIGIFSISSMRPNLYFRNVVRHKKPLQMRVCSFSLVTLPPPLLLFPSTV